MKGAKYKTKFRQMFHADVVKAAEKQEEQIRALERELAKRVEERDNAISHYYDMQKVAEKLESEIRKDDELIHQALYLILEESVKAEKLRKACQMVYNVLGPRPLPCCEGCSAEVQMALEAVEPFIVRIYDKKKKPSGDGKGQVGAMTDIPETKTQEQHSSASPSQTPEGTKCIRCGVAEPADRHWASVYGFCDECHAEFLPQLRTLIKKFNAAKRR